MIRAATRYANERTQFGRPISSFGLIQQKLADMAAKIFAADSAVHRTAGMIDEVMATDERLELTEPGFPCGLEEFDSLKRMEHQACITYTALETGTELDSRLASIRKLFAWTPPNVIELRRSIAKCLCASGDLTSILEESHAIR